MGVWNIRDYTLNKLIFPRILVIDKPGVIINSASAFYGLKQSRKRIAYFFEDDFVALDAATVDLIGKEKTSELNYKIGKHFVSRHLKPSGKEVPSFLRQSFVKKACESFQSAGVSILGNVSFEGKNSFVASGKDNVISRKTGDPSLFSGVVGGLLSHFYGFNIEADVLDSETIISNFDGVERFTPILDEKDFLSGGLGSLKEQNSFERYLSFKDLIKFGEVEYREGKHHFAGSLIVPMEVSIPEVYVKYYRDEGLLDLMRDALVKSSFDRSKVLFESGNVSEKLKKVRNILSGLGWGKLFIDKKGKDLVCNVFAVPVIFGDYSFQAFVLNGYLNYIFGKNHEIASLRMSADFSSAEIVYRVRKVDP